MKRTAVYMRVSSMVQAKEGDSIPAQRDALLKYINDRPELELYGEYLDDGVSGQKYTQRDELQRLLDDVSAGLIDLIIFTKLDRWFRSVRHYTATQEILDKNGVGWLAIWEPIYDTTTPQGRLIVNQMMSIAQFEAENTGQRIRQVQAYKVAQGEVISGSTPPGYKIENKHLVPNEYATTVVEAFERYARTGELYNTVRAFADCPEIPSTQAAFKTMLRNKKYIGEHRGNPDFCQPLISRDLFDAVQIQLSRNVKISQKRVYIFSGLLRCAECGTVMSGAFRTRQRKNCRPEKYKYYRCTKCWNRPVKACDNKKSINETVLERYMLANIKPQISKLVYTVETAPETDNRNRIATLRKKADRLKDLYVSELITLDEYKADKDKYMAEIEALQKQETKPKQNLDELKKLLNMDIESLYQGFTEEQRRFFWRSIIDTIRFDKNRNIEIIFLHSDRY